MSEQIWNALVKASDPYQKEVGCILMAYVRSARSDFAQVQRRLVEEKVPLTLVPYPSSKEKGIVYSLQDFIDKNLENQKEAPYTIKWSSGTLDQHRDRLYKEFEMWNDQEYYSRLEQTGFTCSPNPILEATNSKRQVILYPKTLQEIRTKLCDMTKLNKEGKLGEVSFDPKCTQKCIQDYKNSKNRSITDDMFVHLLEKHMAEQ